MRAEEWERIKTIFEAALNIAEENRAAYLDDVCGGNQDLRRTVDELLASHIEASQFLEDAAFPIQHVFSDGDLVGDRFRIARFISSGGMGEVYEAFDQKLRLRLALKTLRPEHAANRDHLERFQREIRVARGVAHDSVCRVYDLVEHRTKDSDVVIPCLTMQLLDGETLVTYLKRSKPLSPAIALQLIRQIAAGVHALHANGMVHRDLKPSNIMVISEAGCERAVVMDFGLAKPLDGKQEFFESQIDFRAGAPYFMAPELLRGGRPTVASDIYSLGLLVDEMVTQSRAYPAESVQALYYNKLFEVPVPPSQRSDRLPAGWEAVILRCLATDPEKRYSKATEIVDDLERAGTDAAPAAGFAVRASRWLFRKWKLAAAMAVILLTGGLAASLLTRPLTTSVIVYPIVNLTKQSDYDYLCTGTTNELSRRMNQVEGVRVIRYYEPRSTAKAASSDARYSLDGYLQTFESRVRMTVEVIDNHDGRLLWSQDFDRELRNPLGLQSEIVRGAMRAIQGQTIAGPLRGFLGLQAAPGPAAPTSNSSAFDSYIRGKYLLDEHTVPAALDAINRFQNALQEDSSFALAEAGLADAQFVLMDYNQAPNLELSKRALDYAERAVAMRADLPEAQLSLAASRQTMWDWRGAEESYQKTLKLNPKMSRAHRWYGGLILQFGRLDEGLKEAQVAMEIDPYDYTGQCAYGLYLYYSSRYQQAIELLNGTISHKDLLAAHVVLGDVYARLGALDHESAAGPHFIEAIRQADITAAMERKTILQPAEGTVFLRFADRMHALYYAYLGDRARMRPYLDRLLDDMRSDRTSPAAVSWIYAAIGDNDQALTLLEQAVAKRDRQLLYAKIQPYFDNLRSSPRFQNVLKQMNY